MNPVETLKEACQEAIDKWPADGDTTFCNFGCRDVCVAMGYLGFRGLLANDMVAKMKGDPEFAEIAAEAANRLANDGRLVIAGRAATPHGHVAIVFPSEQMVYSAKWGKYAPMVANVGKRNAVMGANFAFSLEPKYWTWINGVA